MPRISYDFYATANLRRDFDPDEFRGLTAGLVGNQIKETLAAEHPSMDFADVDIDIAANAIVRELAERDAPHPVTRWDELYSGR